MSNYLDSSLDFGSEEPFFSAKMESNLNEGKDIYSIKDIETITGIKAHTIRIWEQRYEFLEPKRTPTNIRYYDDSDLRFLLNISVLNKHGYKISKIASMSIKEINEACLKITEHQNKFAGEINELVDSMMNFNEKEFNRILGLSILKKGLEYSMSKLIFPFLEKCGILWITGVIQPAHEHFVSSLIRQKLFVSIDNLNGEIKPNAKKFLLFIPSGETHDIGLLFANYILRARGHQVIYLGSSLPYEDLYKILSVHKPDFIFSIITSISSNIKIQRFVDTLSIHWPHSQILLTGSQILSKKDLQTPENVVILKSPSHFSDLLDEIDS